MENNSYPFVNLPLPYEYDALEPFIDVQTMHLHHDKHLQTYIDNLNAAIEQEPRLKTVPLPELIAGAGDLPQPLQNTVRNNAGGVLNHRFYFDQLRNPSCDVPEAYMRVICQCFGSLDALKDRLKKAALSVFGSGYAWLVADRQGLRIETTPNQNVPLNCRLLLNIDVWEHAYYLKHYNVRASYIDDLLELIDWVKVAERYRDGVGL